MSGISAALPPNISRTKGKSFDKLLIANGFVLSYVIAVGFAYGSGAAAGQASLLWPGIVLGMLSLCTFFYAGSRRILFASAISYGHFLFVASSAVLIGIGRIELRRDLRPSIALVFLSLIFLLQLLLFVFSRAEPRSPLRCLELDGDFQVLAVFLFLVAFASSIATYGSIVDTFLSPLTLVAFVISSLVAATQTTLARTIPHGLILAVIVLLYVIFQFQGFGRLTLASYLFGIAVSISWVRNSYVPKAATVLGTVPGLVILVRNRVTYLESTQGRNVSIDESMGSVFGPFQSGAFILQQSMDGATGWTGGQAHLASLLFWVPRAIWPDKPAGFGRAIVAVTQPQMLSSSTYSDAAPYLAEYVWDFGVLGLVLGMVFASVVVLADRYVSGRINATADTPATRRFMIWLVVWVSAVSMSLNYVWGGSFPFMSRTATGLGMVLLLYWISGNVRRRYRRVTTSKWRRRHSKVWVSPG